MKAFIPCQSRIIRSGLLLASTLSPVSAQMTDRFNDRPQLDTASAVLTADTTYATEEAGETSYLPTIQRENTVWAEWIAPANGWVVMDTLGTTYKNPMIAVFTGTEITALKTVARGYDPGAPNPAKVRFPVSAGTAYQIMLDSTLDNSSGDGPGTVNIRLTPAEIPPSIVGADVFSSRLDLSGSHALGVANNMLAGIDVDEPRIPTRRSHTMWWQWTAPATGKVTLDTLDSEIRTTLTVYAGNTSEEIPFADLDPVVDNNDVPNSQRSRLSFQAGAGRTYQIVVDGDIANGYGEGNIVLRLDLAPNTAPAAIPGADDFARRRDLSGFNAAGAACNRDFTTEDFETINRGERGKTAWWQWTAPADCTMTVETTGSLSLDAEGTGMDTVLKVFTGSVLETLEPVASNNDMTGSVWSKVTFSAKKGVSYQIGVDGNIANWHGEGNIILNLTPVAAPEVTVQQPVGSNLTDGRGKRSFGTVKTGSKGALKTFTIRNTGTATLSGLAIRMTGTHAGDFLAGSLKTSSLAPGASTTFAVRFAPRTKGIRTAAIQIYSNDADENPFDIIVTGFGTGR